MIANVHKLSRRKQRRKDFFPDHETKQAKGAEQTNRCPKIWMIVTCVWREKIYTRENNIRENNGRAKKKFETKIEIGWETREWLNAKRHIHFSQLFSFCHSSNEENLFFTIRRRWCSLPRYRLPRSNSFCVSFGNNFLFCRFFSVLLSFIVALFEFHVRLRESYVLAYVAFCQ